MSAKIMPLVILMVLSTLGTSLAQDYQLGWDQVNKQTPQQKKNYTLGWQAVDRHVSASKAVPMPAPPQRVVTQSASFQAKPRVATQAVDPYASIWNDQPTVEQTYDIQFNTLQFFNHYKDRFLKVQAVEVAIFRKRGSFSCELLENIAEHNSYEFLLEDLQEGDSYEVRVIWEDGSNRTVEQTIGSYVETNIYVDEPDTFAFAADGW